MPPNIPGLVPAAPGWVHETHPGWWDPGLRLIKEVSALLLLSPLDPSHPGHRVPKGISVGLCYPCIPSCQKVSKTEHLTRKDYFSSASLSTPFLFFPLWGRATGFATGQGISMSWTGLLRRNSCITKETRFHPALLFTSCVALGESLKLSCTRSVMAKSCQLCHHPPFPSLWQTLLISHSTLAYWSQALPKEPSNHAF